MVAVVSPTPVTRSAVGTVGACVSGATPGASSTSTQSPSPAAFGPGGVKLLLPWFGNGDPATGVATPSVGSYQDASTAPPIRAMSTVTVRTVGR